MKTGVILINLGSPKAPTTSALRGYLKEFLNDPRVLDIHPFARFLLINAVIVPFRSPKSAEAYQKIWTEDGSPLIVYGKALQKSLQENLGEHFQVELGMCYGEPSIQAAYERTIQTCDSLIVLPLYPQYASSSTGGALESFLKVYQKSWDLQNLKIINNFFDHPSYINSYSELIQKHYKKTKKSHIIFSYHGLPTKHLQKSHQQCPCPSEQSCPKISSSNHSCYRAQCYASTNLITQQLKLTADEYSVAFQSRLGRTPWIQPYLDDTLQNLHNKKIEDLTIVCPSFVSDCLETLEEIGIRAQEDWIAMGGKTFTLVPCLNDHPTWTQGLAQLITESSSQRPISAQTNHKKEAEPQEI